MVTVCMLQVICPQTGINSNADFIEIMFMPFSKGKSVKKMAMNLEKLWWDLENSFKNEYMSVLKKPVPSRSDKHTPKIF